MDRNNIWTSFLWKAIETEAAPGSVPGRALSISAQIIRDVLSPVTDKPVCHPVQASSLPVAGLQWRLLSLGSRVTESQAYTDIYTKDRPAVAGGPSIDKCVFLGGWGVGGWMKEDCSLLFFWCLLWVWHKEAGVKEYTVHMLICLCLW